MASPITQTTQRRPSDVNRIIGLVLLLLSAIAAVYFMFVLGEKKGLFPMITEVMQAETPMYPGSKTPLISKYCGIKAIDKQLATLVTFFSPLVEGSSKALSLYVLWGFGQFGAGWTLFVMESLRKGNQGRVVSYIGTYGFFVQNISFALSTPIYLFIHLLTSPIAKPLPSAYSSNVLLVSSYDLVILPFSVTLGYIIPSLLMVFPGSSPISSPTHQRYIAFWQAFPLWTMIVQWTGKWLCVRLFGHNTAANTPKSSPSKSYLVCARPVYIFTLAMSIITTVPVLILSIIPPDVFPKSIPTLSHFAQNNLASVFVPNPFASERYLDLAEGVLNFIQWDCYIAATASLVWGIILHRNASMEQVLEDPLPVHHELSANARERNKGSLWMLIIKTTFWTIAAGPFGALTILLWERDAILKQKVKEGI